MPNNSLSAKEWSFLILLGIPSSGIALAYTFIIMYLPIFIERLSGAGMTGLMIGGEGIFAMFVPFLIGGWSDSVQTKIGRRLPFVLVGTFLICITLLLMPFSSMSLMLLAIELAVFFIGYFTYFSAYYACFPDLIPNEERGRSQGVQGGFLLLGMLCALVGGGFLLHVSETLPFLIVILAMIFNSIILYYTVRHRIKKPNLVNKEMRINWLAEWELIRDNKSIRLWMIANTLWECSISVLSVFVVLYFTRGVGLSLVKTAEILSLVGISAIFAAPTAGILADRYGHKPVILVSLVFFAMGLLPPIFTVNPYFIIAIFPVAFAAVILMTLPYSLLMGYLPEEKEHGAGAALFLLCQGLGAIFGPLVTGGVIELFKNTHFLVFAKTLGYSALFPVASIFLLASIPATMSLFRGAD